MCTCETTKKDFWGECEECYICRTEQPRNLNFRTYKRRSFSSTEVLCDWLNAVCKQLGTVVPKRQRKTSPVEELTWEDRKDRVTILLREASRTAVGEILGR